MDVDPLSLASLKPDFVLHFCDGIGREDDRYERTIQPTDLSIVFFYWTPQSLDASWFVGPILSRIIIIIITVKVGLPRPITVNVVTIVDNPNLCPDRDPFSCIDVGVVPNNIAFLLCFDNHPLFLVGSFPVTLLSFQVIPPIGLVNWKQTSVI